jgi:hypothetical protein
MAVSKVAGSAVRRLAAFSGLRGLPEKSFFRALFVTRVVTDHL